MKPILLAGVPAWSGFRMQAVLERMNRDGAGPVVARLDAVRVYALDADELAGPQRAHVLALLDATGPLDRDGGFFLFPRKGTVSPWSSKATDIFRNCGIDGVRRVEHGIHARAWTPEGCEVTPAELGTRLQALHDRMTEGVYAQVDDLFDHRPPAPLRIVPLREGGLAALHEANRTLGLALSGEEIEYLAAAYTAAGRDPTDVELVMFGQVNSEHCRHKIFNAAWRIDGVGQDASLFGMIRETHRLVPDGTLVAYSDNSGVFEGFDDAWFAAPATGDAAYRYAPGRVDVLLKVETHNHPTAISPYPGAATGVGGEIRDEGATGIGGRPKAGLSGFMVSHLRIPGHPMPWERDLGGFPDRLATPLAIMLEGPIGGAAFGNEFGRPQLCGLFRTCEDLVEDRHRGYHKPIMVAGGMGNIRREHTRKRSIPAGAPIVQLGGPALRIGLGGGAASSMDTGSNALDLDFDSVQRGNAEMERRCQQVLDACIAMGAANPILSVHDVGAGGLSNACPELVADVGGHFDLRAVPNEEISMSPMEIWCCEAQERYMLAIAPAGLDAFLDACRRERCPAAVIGRATGDAHLTLDDPHFGNVPIDIELAVVLGKPPRMLRDVARRQPALPPAALDAIRLEEAVERVLRFPAVADKTFLITIADRTVTGLVSRDQMVGPHQVPVADVAVTATSFRAFTGEAMAMGERTPVALLSGPASGRMAVGEALTNLAAAWVGDLRRVKLSANWMCACGEPGEDAALFDTVRAVALDFCPRVGVAIPVGKDSLSMRTVWSDADGRARKVVAPLSLVVSAFAPVRDVRRTVTPELQPGATALLLVDFGAGRDRLGGSVLLQVHNQVGDVPPDVENPEALAAGFAVVQGLLADGLLAAYHDRSDGGLFVTLAEMAFAGRRGVEVKLPPGREPLAWLFAEELGMVLQVAEAQADAVLARFAAAGLGGCASRIGRATDDDEVRILAEGAPLYRRSLYALRAAWSELTARMQALRDNPACAREEAARAVDPAAAGLTAQPSCDPARHPAWESVTVTGRTRPRVAILREQGVNGHVEMAGAFDRAGFEAVDVHMTDLVADRASLRDFRGLAACGGFSYGDVLGAGSGWARSILYTERLRDAFRAFFERPDTFTLGVCNGCQMLAQLKDLIPGAGHWPRFVRNRSEQFEARLSMVEVLEGPSVLLAGMAGSRLPIPVAHGEGRLVWPDETTDAGLCVLRYVDGDEPAERYPANPNGSPGGVTGVTSRDGRATILMPHPERAFRAVQCSYLPRDWACAEGPWLRLFQNARVFSG